jgi:hypothetical protein
MQFAKKADGRGVQIAFAERALDRGDLKPCGLLLLVERRLRGSATIHGCAGTGSERLESSQPSRRVASMPRDEPQN